jgi:hypothetical protein
MRVILVSALLALAAATLAPLAGASCHFCVAPDEGEPVYQAIYGLLLP